MAKMDGNWGLTAVGVMFLALQPQACRDDVASHALNDNEAVQPFLNDFADNIVSERLEQVSVQNRTLIASLELAVQDISNEDALNVARADWFASVSEWQELELMQVASFGSSLSAIGGADVRDSIYSWPLNNPCRIDQVTVSQEYLNPDFGDTALVSMRGLDAIEYLLFAPIETECPSQVPPVSDGTWDALTTDEILQQRLDYALVLAQEIQSDIETQKTFWSQGFPFDLYESDVQALNEVFNGMLYVEEMIKERKIHHPLGLKEDCTVDCHLDTEGWYAEVSTEFLLANLQGVKLLLQGVDSEGLKGVLVATGETELAVEIEALVDGLIVELEKIDVPLSTVMEQNPERLDTIQNNLSELTTLLKWDVATVLQMEIPQQSAGDND